MSRGKQTAMAYNNYWATITRGGNNQGAAITEWDALFPFRAHLLASEGTQLDHGGLLPLRHSLAQPQLPKAVLADGQSNMPADVGDCRGVRVTRVRIGLYAGALCAGPLVRESARTGLCWSVVLLHASAIEFVGGRRGSDEQERFKQAEGHTIVAERGQPYVFPTHRPAAWPTPRRHLHEVAWSP